jgi:hypothetical protein
MKGIPTKPGMTTNKIEEAEQRYGIVFPKDLKALYQIAVPVKRGFYDWTDDSPENTWYIKKMIAFPIISGAD